MIPLLRRRAGIKAAAVACVTFAVLLLPWSARNAIEFDRPVLIATEGGETLAGANCTPSYYGERIGSWSSLCVSFDGRGNEAKELNDVGREGIDFALDNTGQIPRVAAYRVARTWSLYGVFDSAEGREPWVTRLGVYMLVLLVPLAVVGLITLRRRSVPVWILCTPLITVTLTSLLAYGNPRFRHSAEIPIVVLAAVAIDRLAPRRPPAPRRPTPPADRASRHRAPGRLVSSRAMARPPMPSSPATPAEAGIWRTGRGTVLAWIAARPVGAAALFYALLSLALFAEALVPGNTLSGADFLYSAAPWAADRPAAVAFLGSNFEVIDAVVQFDPWLQYTRERLPDVPLWNDQVAVGRPYLANAQSAFLSPFRVPGYVLPLWWSLGFMAALKVFAASFGTFLLGRQLGMRFGGALLAGLAFGFSLFFVAWIAWPQSSVFALLPWLLLLTERVLTAPGPLLGGRVGRGRGAAVLRRAIRSRTSTSWPPRWSGSASAPRCCAETAACRASAARPWGSSRPWRAGRRWRR